MAAKKKPAHHFTGPIASINPPKHKPPQHGTHGKPAVDTPVRPGYVLIHHPGDDTLAIQVQWDDKRRTDGVPVWDTVPRPAQQGVLAFRGWVPLQVELDINLDGYAVDLASRIYDTNSVEPIFLTLYKLAGFNGGAKNGKPPLLRIKYSGTTEDTTDWVLTGIDIIDGTVLRDGQGNRLRATVTLTLLEHPKGASLTTPGLKIRKQLPGHKPTIYKARSGDTAISIARKKLHDDGRWPEILRANPKIRDPRAKIKAGTSVRIP